VKDVEATRGTDAVFFCNATGHPDLTYTWGRVPRGINFSDDTFLPGMIDRVIEAETPMLTIENVGRADEMRYDCNVSLFNDLIGSAFGNLATLG
jgi:hypothetical protein